MLTPQETQIIEYGKKNGKSSQEALQALSKYRAGIQEVETQEPSGFLVDTAEDIKGIGTGIKESITKRGQKLGTILEADAQKKQGKLSSIFQTTTNFLGSVGDVAGQVIKGGVKAVLPQKTEDKVKEALGSATKKILDMPETKQFIENYQALEKENPELARNVVALAEGGEFLLQFAGLKAAKSGIDVGIKGSKQAIKTGLEAGEDAASSVIQGGKRALESVGKLADTTEISRLPSRVATNIAQKQATQEAIKQLPSRVAQTAVRDGIDISDVKTIITSSKGQANKTLMKNLAKTAKEFSEGSVTTNPIEVVGKPIVSRIGKLEQIRGLIGKKLGLASEKLGKVTTEELDDAVFKELKSVKGLEGIKRTMTGQLDFSGTTLATSLSKADRMAIRKIFAEATKGGSGKSKHLLRQELFEILGGKKRSLQALTNTQEKAFEAVRKGLSNVLENKNPVYKVLSREYARVLKPLKDMRKLMKAVGDSSDDDILDMSAGLLARRLTSNAPSNPQIRAILREMDNLVVGSKVEGSVEVLQDFYNILNKYYDIAGKTGFQGQVKAGVESAGGVTQFLMGKARNLAGESPAVRQKALEDLLEELLK